MLKVISICLLISGLYDAADSKIVTIKDGSLNGTTWIARDGRPFNAFLGIPFAKPPVGNLRLKAPVKSEPWKGLLNATVAAARCIQYSSSSDEMTGAEDCLYLNVYSPYNATKGDKLPVIFYIFGGAFQNGYSTQNGPHYFLQHDVIMIHAASRLGILGFISTGDSVIPGNFAMKDQVLAMRWMKDNIEEFGGDPNNVTLMGHSSGAACVHLHTYSQMSKGFFHKVIIQSSAGFSTLSLHMPDAARAVAMAAARQVGCDTSSSATILKCFMNAKAETLAYVTITPLFIWDYDPEAVPRPCVEGPDVPDPFLSEDPYKMKYHSPDQPWLLGTMSEEGAYKAARLLSEDGILGRQVNKHYRELLPIINQYYWITKKEDLNYVSDSLRKFYFQDREMNDETAHEMARLFSLGMYTYGILDAMNTYPGPKYGYMYSYEANFTTQNFLGYYPVNLGISHGSEIPIIFLRSDLFEVLTDRDKQFGDEMVLRWVNFITSGNPNYPLKINETMMSYWKPIITSNIEYLRLDINGTMETGLFAKDYNFWKTLPLRSKYY